MDDARTPMIVALLVEGAVILQTRLHDPRGAQRHLAAGLRLRPHDPELRRSYRDVGALIAGDDDNVTSTTADETPFAGPEVGSAVHSSSIAGRASSLDLAMAAEP